ncbi:MAG: alkaline phosphatase family protein [Vicingaceae bacterium]|nr:alkaline phosphatase family protein [Vicingaceae bacterium]
MHKLFFLILITLPFVSSAQKPKLVVGIVVDQMRYDYLTRFWDRYGDDGFKKLINNGYNCKNTHYNYMPTYTGPGHASIYSGTTPENHGIISNTWFDKTVNNYTYCTSDTSFSTLGSKSNHGKMSPNKLSSTTITDELKLATNFKGKTFGISIKDRGAILPAGHNADAAYWFEGGETGKWISSTFYMNNLPEWITKINNSNPAKKYLDKSWNTLYPIKSYSASIADDNPYENVFTTEQKPIFPHNLPTLLDSNNHYSLIKSTPFGNTILKELAIELIKNEKLGTDNHTDFLSVSFSSPDYIGHKYGPMSVEIEDTYLRLDKELAEIITFLEKNIGKENVLIFLTADHGAVNVPQYLIDNKMPGGYFHENELDSSLNKFLKQEYKVDSLVKNISNYQVFLNAELIQKNNWNLESIENSIANFLLNQKGIAKAITSTALKNTEFTDRILANAQRGFNQNRSGNVLFVLKSGWVPFYKNHKGTTHGSPYHYDTHVPLLWYGSGIKKGETDTEVAIPDIAATIAQLLNIQAPSACTGEPIHEIVK